MRFMMILISIVMLLILSLKGDEYKLDLISPPSLGNIVMQDSSFTYTHDDSIDINEFVLDSCSIRPIDEAGNIGEDKFIYILIIPEFKYNVFVIPNASDEFYSNFTVNAYDTQNNGTAIVVKFDTDIDVYESTARGTIRDVLGHTMAVIDFEFVLYDEHIYAVAIHNSRNLNTRELGSGTYRVTIDLDIYSSNVSHKYGDLYIDQEHIQVQIHTLMAIRKYR